MNTPTNTQNDQATAWNGLSGNAWVDLQPTLDRLFQPFADLLVQSAAASPPRRILDIGCGAGATTLALARSLGASCQYTGVDISEPLLAAARGRAFRENLSIDFLRADAGSHPFPPAAFDRIVSRFGVMFFDDPVRAFANLHRAAAPHAILQVLTWRDPSENPFMTAAERATAHLLPALPPRRPNAPGQFGLSAPGYTRGILSAAKWNSIDIQPVDVPCTLPASDLVPYLTRLGPVAQPLRDAPEPLRTQIVEAAVAAFAPFRDGPNLRFTAACWRVTAEV